MCLVLKNFVAHDERIGIHQQKNLLKLTAQKLMKGTYLPITFQTNNLVVLYVDKGFLNNIFKKVEILIFKVILAAITMKIL